MLSNDRTQLHCRAQPEYKRKYLTKHGIPPWYSRHSRYTTVNTTLYIIYAHYKNVL